MRMLRGVSYGCWFLVAACSGGGHLVQEEAPPAVQAVQAPAQPDAFGDHRGQLAQPGERFRIAAKPVGVAGVRVVVALTRVEWETITTPSGKEVREAVAVLVVRQGEDERSLRINQNDHKSAMGARFEVVGAGEDYNRQRMTTEPWVEMVVSVAPDR